MRDLSLELPEIVYSVNALDMRKARNPGASDQNADTLGKICSDFSKNFFSVLFRQCHDSQYEGRCIRADDTIDEIFRRDICP